MFTPLAVLPESGLTTKLAQCAGQRAGTSASVCGQAYCCGVLTCMLNEGPVCRPAFYRQANRQKLAS